MFHLFKCIPIFKGIALFIQQRWVVHYIDRSAMLICTSYMCISSITDVIFVVKTWNETLVLMTSIPIILNSESTLY